MATIVEGDQKTPFVGKLFVLKKGNLISCNCIYKKTSKKTS